MQRADGRCACMVPWIAHAVRSTGAAASAADPLVSNPSVYFGDFVFTAAPPLYAGLSPGSVGLYQVNVTIPPGVPTGNVDLKVMFPDGTISNPVQIAVQ